MDNEFTYAKCPWRRYFARELDLSIYMAVWNAFLTILFSFGVPRIKNIFLNQLIGVIVSVGIILLIEPLLLHLFGTTPGKKILGLRVTKEDGSYLTIKEGQMRTWSVLKNGMGFMIPIYSLFKLYKSYCFCKEQGQMVWDQDYCYTVKPSRWYMWIVYIVAWFTVFSANMVIALFSQIAPNRKVMNAAEFAENYNYIAEVYDLKDLGVMNPDGSWKKDDTYTVYLGNSQRPEFQLTETNGVLTSVSFQIEGGGKEMASTGNAWMTIAALAYTNGQKGMGVFSAMREALFDQLTGYEDFHFSIGDITLSCERELEGYTLIESMDYLVPDEQAEKNYYKTVFEMKR